MKNTSKLMAISLGLGSVATVNIQQTLANHNYYSPAPIPPALPEVENVTYITENVNGTEFYIAEPFYYKQTSDRNIYVSSVITMKSGNNVQLSYVQIDCGRLKYKDIIPWISGNLLDFSVDIQPTTTYSWQYFTRNSAFETVGKYLCQESAQDMGLSWNWN